MFEFTKINQISPGDPVYWLTAIRAHLLNFHSLSFYLKQENTKLSTEKGHTLFVCSTINMCAGSTLITSSPSDTDDTSCPSSTVKILIFTYNEIIPTVAWVQFPMLAYEMVSGNQVRYLGFLPVLWFISAVRPQIHSSFTLHNNSIMRPPQYNDRFS